ncbi:hypothetical protein [Bradyrhizobium sp. WSM3983]|nr:hypothetical protein [Bradyrhizobium sp. WSM3983]
MTRFFGPGVAISIGLPPDGDISSADSAIAARGIERKLSIQ